MAIEGWLPKKPIFNDAKMIAARLRNSGVSVVTIDGGPGAGKTTLARKVALLLGWHWHDLDTNLPGDDAPYIEQVDRVALAKALRSRPLVLSGICMRQVLEFAPTLVSQTSIYVVRETTQGLPGDLALLDAENRGHIEPLPRSSLDRQVQVYHRDYKPVQLADWFFVRREL